MKQWCKRILCSIVLLPAFTLLTLWLLPKPPLLDGIPFSSAVYDRNGVLLRLELANDDTYRVFTPFEKISPLLIESTLLYEDRYFYQHTGANPVSLGRAVINEAKHSGTRLGASTITMQVARLRYHLNTRTWIGKLRQIWFAARIETHYSKREILEAYFNLAPYGRNIEGVGAASLVYFEKSASDLTLGEALTLGVIPQNPSRRAPGKNIQPLLAARRILFQEWVNRHPADEDSHSLLEMPLQARSLENLPFIAPHFTDEMATAAPRAHHITTTLDAPLQKLLEKKIQSFIAERKRDGISNAAAVLIDYQTMEVLASVGSANFLDKEINGQVNGASMKRSPGSALKPFVYALALDQGIIQPHSLLKDAPTSFSAYNPENFDRDFMGPVQACDALVQSRNIPAVYLASRLKEHSLYNLLLDANVSGLRPENFYGLTIALGSAEVSPENLACLYATLANKGVFHPLCKTLNQKMESGKRLLSPEASFLVLDMLKKNSMPGRTAQEYFPVAWKTGTSYSCRDAWTAGVFDHYILVTWVGNFDGKPNPALVGRSTAAVLFFSAVNSIRSHSPSITQSSWTSMEGLNIAQVDLCAVTGELATENCHHHKKGWFIPGVSPIATCKVHQEIFIDPHTGYRVASINNVLDARREVWEVWPSDLQALFKYAGLPRRNPPSFAPESTNCVASRETVPEIVSPRQGLEYHLRLDEKNPTVPLQANASSQAQTIHWFAGKTYLGASAPGETLFWRTNPGSFEISAIDDLGHAASRHLTVVASE